VPFLVASGTNPSLEEHDFVDSVSRAMRHGRFLILIAGDGIKEDLSVIADIINRNAALAFSIGRIEVALYDLTNSMAIRRPA
jgi:hypothetical protein